MDQRGRKKVKSGIVVSNKMEKTITVRVDRTCHHPRYRKAVVRGKKYYAHVEGDKPAMGAEVVIVETRPLSKLKRWRLVEVVAQENKG